MSLSVPGILISRDGTIRRYVGHSKRSGTLLGRATRQGQGWDGTCAGCGSVWWGHHQRNVAEYLRQHWDGLSGMDPNHNE